MRPLLFLALPAIVVPMLSGCASLTASGKPTDLPAMNVPPPPPRLIEPAPEPLPEPVADLPATPPPSSTVNRGGTRPSAPRPAPPETKPATDPKPVEPPPTTDPAPVPQPPPVAPAAQLRTPQTADTSNVEKGVRSMLDRAKMLLSNVDYRLLNAERKKAYDDSMRFIKQTEDALKEGNFVAAQPLAVKAETLAKELAGK